MKTHFKKTRKAIITSLVMFAVVGSQLISCSKNEVDHPNSAKEIITVKGVDLEQIERSPDRVRYKILQIPQFQLSLRKIQDKPNKIVVREELIHLSGKAHNETFFTYEFNFSKPIETNPFTGSIKIKNHAGTTIALLEYVDGKNINTFRKRDLELNEITIPGLGCWNPSCNEPEFSNCVDEELQKMVDELLLNAEELAKCLVDVRGCLIEKGVNAGIAVGTCWWRWCRLFS